MALSLKRPAFAGGKMIPRQFTGEGEDRSPPLQWSKVPEGVREFVLICEDPDAPQEEPFVHWLAFNISPSVTELPEGLPGKRSIEFPVRVQQGVNSFGNIGYGGPFPPVGHGSHRYFFRLFALDAETNILPGATKDEVLHAIRNHIIDQAELIGVYERKKGKAAA